MSETQDQFADAVRRALHRELAFVATFAAAAVLSLVAAVPVFMGWHQLGPIRTADLMAAAILVAFVNAGLLIGRATR